MSSIVSIVNYYFKTPCFLEHVDQTVIMNKEQKINSGFTDLLAEKKNVKD